MKEIKDDTNRGRNIPCSWTRRTYKVKIQPSEWKKIIAKKITGKELISINIQAIHTTQSNLQIQCNPYQATNGIFQRIRTNNFAICMELQKTSNSQSNLEKEEWNRRNQPA